MGATCRALGLRDGKSGKMVLLLSPGSQHGPGDCGNAHSEDSNPLPAPHICSERPGVHPAPTEELTGQGAAGPWVPAERGRLLSTSKAGYREGTSLSPSVAHVPGEVWQGASPGCFPAPSGQQGEAVAGQKPHRSHSWPQTISALVAVSHGGSGWRGQPSSTRKVLVCRIPAGNGARSPGVSFQGQAQPPRGAGSQRGGDLSVEIPTVSSEEASAAALEALAAVVLISRARLLKQEDRAL